MTPDNRLERRWRRRLNLSGSRSTSPHNSSKPCRQSLHDDQHNSEHQQNSNSDSYLKENHHAQPQPDGVVDDDHENNCNFQEQQTTDNFNDGDGDVDPDYKLFLDNLREFRKSYVLELAGFVVHYEEERSLHDGGEKVEEGVEKGDTGMVDEDYAKFLGWVEEQEEFTPNFGDGSVMGGDFGRRREVEEELEEAVDYGMDGNDSVMVDKEYATFLDWIEEEVEEEKEVCTEGAVADGMCERAEDGGDIGENAGLADDVVEVDGMVSSESKLVEDGENAGLVDDGVKVGGMVSGERNLVEDSEKGGLVDDEVEVDGMVSSERNLIGDGENAGGVDDGVKMDERVSSERKLVEGEDGDGDGDEDEPSCYIVEQDSHLDSFVDVDSGTSNVKSSRYRENLMDILKIPYDEKEYIVFKRDISIKKRMERHRELRNNSLKSCPIDRLGNSYLDSYPDVEKRMQEAPYDKHRALKIMRGFFYWLKNLTQDGAFQPWLDKSFLEGVSK